MKPDPKEVARWADWPVDELDLSARQLWLLEYRRHLASRLAADAGFYEPKIAGWWVWGIAQWIGGGWCSSEGPWQNVAGEFVKRQRPGVTRHLPAVANAGHGVHRPTVDVLEWMQALSERLRRVRVCCGDWSRVLSTGAMTQRPCAVFLDPPYAMEGRGKVYDNDEDIFGKVREWAFAHGEDKTLRIALCGYDDGVPAPEGWECVHWKATGGYGNLGQGRGRANASRERIWFSPGCEQKSDECQNNLSILLDESTQAASLNTD